MRKEKKKREENMLSNAMKIGKKLNGNVKEGKKLLKMYASVPHQTLSLHYNPRKSYRYPKI